MNPINLLLIVSGSFLLLLLILYLIGIYFDEIITFLGLDNWADKKEERLRKKFIKENHS